MIYKLSVEMNNFIRDYLYSKNKSYDQQKRNSEHFLSFKIYLRKIQINITLARMTSTALSDFFDSSKETLRQMVFAEIFFMNGKL